MKNRVLKTEEIFRVTYMDGDFERFMKQSYTNDAPFYYVSKGNHNRVPVDTSNSDLREIEKNLKRFLRIDATALKSEHNKRNPKVMAVVKHCIAQQRLFLKKFQEFKEKELKLVA